MTPEELASSTQNWFSCWIKDGPIHDSNCVPRTLRIAFDQRRIIAELAGAQSRSEALEQGLSTLPTKKLPDVTRFFVPGFSAAGGYRPIFDGRRTARPAAGVAIPPTAIRQMWLTLPHDRERLRQKFGSFLPGTEISGVNADSFIKLPTWDNWFTLSDVALVRTEGIRVLLRYVQWATLVQNTANATEWNEYLQSEIGSIIVPSVFARAEKLALDLISLGDENVTESVLDSFLGAHSGDFARALGYQRAIPKPVLKWVTRTQHDSESIIPDYMMVRPDGFCDILDLKKAALQFRSIRRGNRARSQFVAYVNDMIAQLATYDYYFRDTENARWAQANHGIVVSEPLLIGVVGNFDTFLPDEVDRASRHLHDRFWLMSYADLADSLRTRK